MILYPNAKINLGLNIVEKRPDGYHNIETVFYPIGLTDIVELEPSKSCSDYSFSTDGITIDGDPEQNLIVKAYRLLQQECAIPPIDITLIKQIPFGAGLGGGSSDAAFVLKGLNDLFDLGFSNKGLEHLAAKLGADCPFFIENKPVFAKGIGNEFTPVDLSLKGFFLVLVKPDIHVSTPQAYANVTPCRPAQSLLKTIKLPVSEWKDKIVNDFEKSVFEIYPEIAEIKHKLYEMGAVYTSMSGSGSSVYGLFDEEVPCPSEFESYFVTGGFLE